MITRREVSPDDPAMHTVDAVIATEMESVSPFNHTDAPFAADVPALAAPKPALAFIRAPGRRFRPASREDPVNLGGPVLEAYDRGDKACCLPAPKRPRRPLKDYQRAVGEDAHPFRAGDVLELEPSSRAPRSDHERKRDWRFSSWSSKSPCLFCATSGRSRDHERR